MARLIDGRFALEDSPYRQGGSATVYKGVVVQGGRPVAVKIFTPARSMDERLLREIFNRELEALVSLGQHPNVVELIDWGLDDGEGHPYVVLEWVDRDLVDLLEHTAIEGWDDLAPLAIGILRGISAVHALGRAHRDVKPENVLIAADGTPKVSDFGISKLRDRLSQGLTLSKFGTPPYMPPEEDDGNYTLTRDVFAFAVLVVRAMCGVHLDNHRDVLARLEVGPQQIDVPQEVLEFLIAALSIDPRERPQSAEAALGQLHKIQAIREAAWIPQLEIHLGMAHNAVEAICARLDIDAAEAFDFLLTDAQEAPGFIRARDVLGDNENDQDLFLLGSSFRYRLRPHNQQAGVLAVIGATKVPPSELELQRTRSWRGPVTLRKSAPLDPQRAAKAIEQLQAAITEHEQLRAERDAKERERQLFRSWRALLDAKRQIEESRGVPLRYRSFRADGQRIHFDLTEAAPPEAIGDPRLVRIGRGQKVVGEVEDVQGSLLTLFRERGDPGALPRSGLLEYDSEAAKFAIDRQRDALEAIRHNRAVRPDLGPKLLKPNGVALPVPATINRFFEENLDEAKRDAIRAALGSEDFVLVEGPPGTGKTTFIAELVAQFLRANPTKRVLLSSQTHIALDNALERIQQLVQGGLLRIGRSERISAEVEALRLDNQMEAWRAEVLRESRLFLREYAAELGIAVPEADVTELSGELKRVRQSLHDLRSSIQHRLAEKRDVSTEVAQLNQFAATVLDVAERVESSLRVGAADSLREAAQLFLNRGVDLAAALDTGGGLSGRLVELEQSIVDRRQEVNSLESTEEKLRSRLAEALGLSADAPPSAEELILLIASQDSARHPMLEKLQEIYAEWEERFGRASQFNGALLERSRVVAATCVGLAGIRGAFDVTFDLCILDEASKATATEALVPMSRARRWVVVGDRHQLPPFQEDALHDPALLAKFELTKDELEHTLFDHLADSLPDECKFLLTEQYRMVPSIGRLISECFYEGKLISHEREPKSPIMVLGASVSWLSTSRNAKRREHPVGTSFANPLEAQEIKAVLSRLNFAGERGDAWKHTRAPLRIAVLTGYAAQRDHILRTIEESLPGWPALQVQVSTVDAFQGKEADVDIFSVVRSNTRAELGFLASRRRLNVALSRGRDALVIVGDADFCRSVSAVANPIGEVLRYIDRQSDCRLDEVET